MTAIEVTEIGVGDGKGISVLYVLYVAESYKEQIWFSIIYH
jgi:hypothetical protein